MRTKLNQAHKRAVVDGLLTSIRVPREEALSSAMHSLALRMTLKRFGADVFDRCRALPVGWLGVHRALYLKDSPELPRYTALVPASSGSRMSYSVQRPNTTLYLDEARPLPNSFEYGWNREAVGDALWDEVVDWFQAHVDLHEQIEQVRRESNGVLEQFRFVDDLATEWPEGYAFFPHEKVATGQLPVVRIADLNARVEAVRRAA